MSDAECLEHIQVLKSRISSMDLNPMRSSVYGKQVPLYLKLLRAPVLVECAPRHDPN